MTDQSDTGGALLVPTHLLSVDIDDHLIVYDPEREQAHLLNHSAAAVWLQANAPASTHQLLAALADRFDIDPAVIGPDVERVVAELVQKGLLAHEPPDDPIWPAGRADRARPAPRPDSRDRPSPTRAAPVVRARALDVEITIWSDHSRLTDWLTTVLDPLATDPIEPTHRRVDSTSRLEYRLESNSEESEDRISLVIDGAEHSPDQRPADAASTILWHTNREVIERTSTRLLLHSSGVANDRGVLALPAISNSGKSTLATALIRAGYRYVTDEALALDPATLLVHPYPKPIGLDPGSFPLFPDLEPSYDQLPPGLFHDKWWLDPRRISPLGREAIAPPCLPLRAVVFPTYTADATPSLEPVEPAEGVILLARNAFNLKRWGQTGLDLLATIATSVPLYRMTHNDLDVTLEMVEDVIGPPPPTRDAPTP